MAGAGIVLIGFKEVIVCGDTGLLVVNDLLSTISTAPVLVLRIDVIWIGLRVISLISVKTRVDSTIVP